MRIGIDLGGTKTEVVVLGDAGEARLRKRIPTPRGDYAATVTAIATLVKSAEAESGPALAADGGAEDEAAMQRYETRLARALAQVINILDPDAIVLGGGLSNLDRLYDRVPRLWGEWVFSDHIATRLLKNKHGDSSGVRGAAWLWPK